LRRVAENLNIDLSQGSGALFDAIECDDDNVLSLKEFEAFFLNQGWTQTGTNHSAVNNNAAVRKSTTSVMSGTSSVGTGTFSASNKKDIVYVVEKCEVCNMIIYRSISILIDF
jgi:hypothetical protein